MKTIEIIEFVEKYKQLVSHQDRQLFDDVFSSSTKCIKRETHEFYGIQGLETQVVQKENGQWKIVHVHYSK